MDNMNYIPETQDAESNSLMHYGIKYKSGRYKYGSGENPYQHDDKWLNRYNNLKAQGFDDQEIARAFGYVDNKGKTSTGTLRTDLRIAKNQQKIKEYERIVDMYNKGMSTTDIARELYGDPRKESTVRSKISEANINNRYKAENVAKEIISVVDKKKIVDVGRGVESQIGVTEDTLNTAIRIAELQGYEVYNVGIRQATAVGQQTITKVLAVPGTTYGEAYKTENIQSLEDFVAKEGGAKIQKLQYPASLDSKRVGIRYAEEGGEDRDGLIEIRRGVADLDLGNSHYAQVRILVDGKKYIKGMALYSDNLPDGVDVLVNSNKPKGTPKLETLKDIKTDDPNNPFGAAIMPGGQSNYISKDGKEMLSPINKLKEEGSWEDMSKNLSSQFLSKQPRALIKQQLSLTEDSYKRQYDDIMSLTNNTVKKELLKDFADTCDKWSVTMKAVSLPGQSTKVLIPIPDMKENEVYCPAYQNGTQLALVRYPNAGTFEIPIVTVNNNSKAAKGVMGPGFRDAIGVTKPVADKMSGADFDGDQVVAIPITDTVKISARKSLEGLVGFDPKKEYPPLPGSKRMKKSMVQKEMGMISNLITDMTLAGASDEEMTRAVKQSMIVIDAQKKELNYTKSAEDFKIKELKIKYQGVWDEEKQDYKVGAATLMSKKNQDIRLPETIGQEKWDPKTGKIIPARESGRTYIDKSGKVQLATKKDKLMRYTEDLRTLSSGTVVEEEYAKTGNFMKDLANQARKSYMNTPNELYSKEAAITYKKEVDSLNAKLINAKKNAPRERKAQILTNNYIKAIKADNPELEKKEEKKLTQIALKQNREITGANGKDSRIIFTDREWEAISKGAISSSKQAEIFKYADSDNLKELAMPKRSKELSSATISRIKSMQALGYTYADIADVLSIAPSTVGKYLS